jgi:hypothetical protein
MTELRLSEVSSARQAFIRRCQRLHFGTIRGLEVHDGEPVFGPNTEVVYDLKLDTDDSPRPEQGLTAFVLCDEIRRLFAMLDAFRNGTIEHIEVRAGIPRRIVFKAASFASLPVYFFR